MKKRILFTTLLAMLGLIAACSDPFQPTPDIMKLPSGFSIRGKGEYNTKLNPISVSSYEEFTKKASALIANQYEEFYFTFSSLPRSGTKTADKFIQMLEIDAYISYGYIVYDSAGIRVDKNTPIRDGMILGLGFSYSVPKAASRHTRQTAENYFEGQVNAASLLRKAKYTPRAEDFEDFPLSHTNQTMPVTNSEELWWACESGYWPTFNNTNSRAYAIFEEVKSISRNIICDSMTDFEKIMSIYDYITTYISYDYDALNDDYWPENVAYYLEGSVVYQRGVCDSFSKLFSMLAGLECLDVVRGFGYQYEGQEIKSGHAWNYASIDEGNTWYLCCSTWGRRKTPLKENHKQIETTEYSAAFTKTDYFHDAGGYDFVEEIWPDYNKVNSFLNTYALDTFSYNGQVYDYIIDTIQEFEILLNAIKDTGVTKDFAISIKSDILPWYDTIKQNEEFKNEVKRIIRSIGYDVAHEGFYMFGEGDQYNSGVVTFLITK